MAPTIGWIIAVRQVAAAAALAACLAGCSTFHWEGRWVGRRQVPSSPGDNPLVVGTLSIVDLTIHGDGTFDLFSGGVPRSGRVRYGNGTATLVPLRILDRPVGSAFGGAQALAAEIHLRSRPDGAVSLSDPHAEGGAEVVLQRQAQPPQDAPRTH